MISIVFIAIQPSYLATFRTHEVNTVDLGLCVLFWCKYGSVPTTAYYYKYI
jgi:hypothetical protein